MRDRGVKMVPIVSSKVNWVNGHQIMRWKDMKKNILESVGVGGELKPPRPSTVVWYLMSFSQVTPVAAPFKKC